MIEDRPVGKVYAGDLARVIRRPAVHSSIKFYTQWSVQQNDKSPRWVGIGSPVWVPKNSLAIVCGVVEEPKRGNRWVYVLTPSGIGWLSDLMKDTVEAYNIEVIK